MSKLPALALTDKQHVENQGQICPFCQAEDAYIGFTDMGVDGEYAWQNCQCYECEMEWTDLFKMIGYEPMERDLWDEEEDEDGLTVAERYQMEHEEEIILMSDEDFDLFVAHKKAELPTPDYDSRSMERDLWEEQG